MALGVWRTIAEVELNASFESHVMCGSGNGWGEGDLEMLDCI